MKFSVEGVRESARTVARNYATLVKPLRLVWRASPKLLLVSAGLSGVIGVLPATQAWVAKGVIDAVAQGGAASASDAWARLAPWVGIELALACGLLALVTVRTQVDRARDWRTTVLVDRIFLGKARQMDVADFETPAHYDRLSIAEDARTLVTTATNELDSFVQSVVALVTIGAGLFLLGPWIPLAIALAAVPAYLVGVRVDRRSHDFTVKSTAARRRSTYFFELLTEERGIKDIRLYGMERHLETERHELRYGLHKERQRLEWQAAGAKIPVDVLGQCVYYGTYAFVGVQAAMGKLTLGEMTMFIVLFGSARTRILRFSEALASLNTYGLKLRDFFAFCEPAVSSVPSSGTTDFNPREGIRFEDVWFRYPGRTEWVLRGVSFHLEPNEKLGLVGGNGAGKSTIAKLALGLYLPTHGRVLFQGVDTRTASREDLWGRTAALFQDYMRYEGTLAQNVAIGARTSGLSVEAAARKGGADEVATAMPKGYDTMLGSRFDDAQNLSGGQWQKVALSRAFASNADLIVLDEPCSALDAEQENVLFRRMRSLTDGRMAMLISHRFSTLRIADQILVLEDGGIQDAGTHAELMGRPGLYSRLFNLQAEGYQPDRAVRPTVLVTA